MQGTEDAPAIKAALMAAHRFSLCNGSKPRLLDSPPFSGPLACSVCVDATRLQFRSKTSNGVVAASLGAGPRLCVVSASGDRNVGPMCRDRALR